MVFHSSVSDSHLHTIAWIMVAPSVLCVSIDRQLMPTHAPDAGRTRRPLGSCTTPR
jgi:hypothetical protein